MKTQKNVSLEDFKTVALSTQETSQLKGGGERGHGNVEVIVELIWD